MKRLYLMVTIVTRHLGEKYLNFYQEHELEVQLVTLGRGTVNDAMLDSFGLESHEKAVLFSFVTREKWRELQKGMHKKLQIDLPGTGVAFLLPVGSIGGRGVYTFLTRKFEMEGEEEMADTEYEMIIAVANQGYIEPIMEAARSAGAGGGTVIHAKGTGMNEMGKFFGMSLAAEKEMTMIVTRKEQKNDIMRAIMERAGMESKAKTFLFSLPVSGVAGVSE